MNLLFRIVYAAHANGTHHKIALDSLKHLASPGADAWQRVFLKHVDLYLEGSKAPDDTFKDFKNHVLHVRDDYWGGAPEKAQNWYGHLVEALQISDWAQAAYSAGVLSHYYSDPIMPFHTAQSEAENAIHRAAEWSINRSYNALRADAEARHGSMTVARPAGDHWLKDLVIQGAETSNPYYEKLIAHYDIHAGAVDPPSGLDQVSRNLVAELLMYASKGFAVILDGAIAESKAVAPDVSLTADTVLAALKIPLKFVQKKLSDASDRALVEAMYDELKATGKVEASLPEDDRTVRNAYAAEVLAPRAAKQKAERARRLPAAAAPAEPARAPRSTANTPPPALARDLHAMAAAAPIAKAAPVETPAPALSTLKQVAAAALKESDNVEAAPSIGPKMAERLEAVGIVTVRDLLAADTHAAAMKLGDRRITADTLRDWQDQARLVMTIPGLRGGQAQLLVGAGYRSLDAIADCPAEQLCVDVLMFAATTEGQRVLREGPAPDFERIKSWASAARAAKAA